MGEGWQERVSYDSFLLEVASGVEGGRKKARTSREDSFLLEVAGSVESWRKRGTNESLRLVGAGGGRRESEEGETGKNESVMTRSCWRWLVTSKEGEGWQERVSYDSFLLEVASGVEGGRKKARTSHN